MLLSERGISDISVTIFQGNFTHPFLARKRKGEGNLLQRDQTLTYKNNIYIHWEYVLQLRRLQRLQEMLQKSAVFILSPQVNSSSQSGHGRRVQLCPKDFLFFFFIFLKQNKTNKKKPRRIKSTVAAVSLLFSQCNHLPLLCEDEHGAAAHAQQKSASSLAAVGFDCVLASIPWRKRERIPSWFRSLAPFKE